MSETADHAPLTLPDLAELSDEILVELCQKRGAKDDRPFRELFRRYRSGVWRTCYGFMRNREDADDLTQDVFFKAYRALDRFEGRSSLKTWLYRIAINSCKNEVRRRSRRPPESDTTVEVIAEVVPMEGTPETYWLDRLEHDQLAQAFLTLRVEEQHILQMKDMEDRPYAEIADRLEIGLSAAKMRVQRARLALKEAYQQLTAAEEAV